MKRVIFFFVIILIATAVFLVFHRPTLNSAPLTAPISDHYEIREQDNGNTFTYTPTSRFLVILDSNRYPQAELVCLPLGIIGEVSNAPAVEPPNYAANFQAITLGSCQLTVRDFHVTIDVANQ